MALGGALGRLRGKKNQVYITDELRALQRQNEAAQRGKQIGQRGVEQRRMELSRMLFHTGWAHNLLMRRWAVLTYGLLLMAFLGWVTSVLAAELRLSGAAESSIDSAKSLTTLSTATLVGLVVVDYHVQLQTLKLHREVPRSTTIYEVGWLRPLVLECLACALHLPAGVQHGISFEVNAAGDRATYELEGLFAVVVSTRVFLLYRFVTVILGFTSAEARNVGRVHRERLGLRLTFSYLSADRPMVVLGLLSVPALCVLTYAVRVAEVVVNEDVYRLENGVWLTIVTSTTVGYGDVTSAADAGRVCLVLACLAGVLAIAFASLTVDKGTSLHGRSARAHASLRRTQARIAHRDAAVVLIQRLGMLHVARRAHPDRLHLKLGQKWQRARKQFRATKNEKDTITFLENSLVPESVAVYDHFEPMGEAVRRAEDRAKRLRVAVKQLTDMYSAPVRAHHEFRIPPLDDAKKEEVLRRLSVYRLN